MRILVLSKRQYMNKDLIDDRYGRFRELPLALSSLGHDVFGMCLSYRIRNEGTFVDGEKSTRVFWHLFNLHRLSPFGTKNYWNALDRISLELQPDLVWACSDAIHAILGIKVARRLKASLVIDLYDNFESYPLTQIPGISMSFHRALQHADGITCVSQPLARYLKDYDSCTRPVKVIENAVPEGIFYPMDRTASRRKLGLPQVGIFIGTAGAISKSRGIETLFKAFEILARERSDIHLVLAGACDKDITLPQSSRVHYLGMLPMNKVPVFLSSLNVSVICNRESAFGKYCFPQKFYESVACGLPVVAAATGSMLELLKDKPEYLFEPENIENLVEVLRLQIANPSSVPFEVPSWSTISNELVDFFRACVKK